MPLDPAPLYFRTALLAEGWARHVRIETHGGLVARIETGVPPAPGDEVHAIALPGLPNLHSHAFQRGMAGLAERRGAGDDSFWTWREVMYRFLDRLGPEDMQGIAALAYMEMLETGFTRVGEFHYLHHAPDGRPYADPAEMAAAIAAAAAETGIALTLLPVFYAHSGFGGLPPGEGQRRFICDLDQFARLREGCRTVLAALPDTVLGVAPHSLRAVTSGELAQLLELAMDGPVHIHIAEQTREVEDCLAWSGQRPVQYLLDRADVDDRWCAVHATHLTTEECVRLAASGAVAGLCPITEANLGDGLFPAPAFLAAGGRFGIGSDSNVLIDPSEELRLLEYGQRLHARRRNILADADHTGNGAGNRTSSGATLFGAALAGGARALGVAAGIGQGRAADIVSLDANHPSLIGRTEDGLLDGWIFAAGRGGIDCVWRRGRRVVSRGRHQAREAIAARYAGMISRLL
ncbi:formimidoylglutamate deiminase [Novosphingobium sp. CF614]|uniref:formimidoylglutamate deiminase n=1 Tax=Novosphingobium sp. CF614 TaxID=1884364 RepID=UPI0008F370EB|nr:formimidoylglutamate deiminase [Novosphingobium sp. CF614]SFF98614.1 formimidoylglutamate deiminase [Novosphingobium sp. CF614]